MTRMAVSSFGDEQKEGDKRKRRHRKRRKKQNDSQTDPRDTKKSELIVELVKTIVLDKRWEGWAPHYRLCRVMRRQPFWKGQTI